MADDETEDAFAADVDLGEVGIIAEALRVAGLRGTGPQPWGVPLDPLAFLLDAIQDGIVLREVDGVMLYANREGRRYAGQEAPARQDAPREVEELLVEGHRVIRRHRLVDAGRRRVVLEVWSRRPA